MEIHIAITDDTATDRERLTSDIERFFAYTDDINCTIRHFASGEALAETFSEGEFHIVFLDILMGDLNGIETAKKLRKIDPQILIVFLTSSKEYAFYAFPLHAFDYLIKPYTYETLRTVLREAMRVLTTSDPEVIIKGSRTEYELPPRKISSAVSSGHSVDVFLSNGTSVRSTMVFKEIEAMHTKDARFLVINRGVIINMDQVLSVDNEMFHMKTGASYPIRVRSRSALVARFSQYMIERMEARKTF